MAVIGLVVLVEVTVALASYESEIDMKRKEALKNKKEIIRN